MMHGQKNIKSSPRV